MMEVQIPDPLYLPVLALRGLVIFPEMLIHFDVGRKKSIAAIQQAMSQGQKIFLVAQNDMRTDDPGFEDLYKIGVAASIRQILKLPGNTIRVVVEGHYRAELQDLSQTEPYLAGTIQPCVENEAEHAKSGYKAAVVRKAKILFEDYANHSGRLSPDVLMSVVSIKEAGKLADYIASNIMLEFEDKQEMLAELHCVKRLIRLCEILYNENEMLQIEQRIDEKLHEQIEQNQREYYLREQIKVISRELGDAENPQEENEKYLKKLSALKLPEETHNKLEADIQKLAKMPPGSHEGSVLRNYLETCLELPWNKETKDHLDLDAAFKVLERDHYGLKKVKERILELLAVRKLVPDITGQIICLVGPPGVGKTSIARSIAKAMGRKYYRISLGGVKDETEIRGHRKTYIGAMPGRIINAVKHAGSRNALILLDEVDKLSSDYKGDPSSALLEVLDPEQNFSFRDHYIEVPFDLSRILFITTANDASAIPAPLLDRMEIIELSSYTREEKFNIAKRHLLLKQIKKHGLTRNNLKLQDAVIYALIDGYTREAGVRNLEKMLAALCRKAAKEIAGGIVKRVTIDPGNLEKMLGPAKYKPDVLVAQAEPGVVSGLAWTSVGGEVMPVESVILDGSGKLELTGNLGEVMKESARTAISLIRSRTEQLGIDKDFYKKSDIHIHVPEGAIPKDGPSAGITITTSLVSALIKQPVRGDLAMTGEITLRGRVLPIGGLKEKSMAAYRMGIKTVIIPVDNQPDLAEIDEVVRDAIQFIPAKNIDDVLENAILYTQKAPYDKMPPESISVIKNSGTHLPAVPQ